MNIVLMALLGVLLAFAVVRIGAWARKDSEASPDEGLHTRRVGEGLRRLKAMQEKYAVMTEPLLAETKDEDLIEAVLSNLWAKMKPDLSDAMDVMGRQTPERQRVFALYAVTGGAKQAGFEKLKKSTDAPLLPTALEALSALDMPESAAALQGAINAEADADTFREPYAEAFRAEQGRERMAGYIREHARAFWDGV